MQDKNVIYSILYELDEQTLFRICLEIAPHRARYSGNAVIIIDCLEGNIEIAEEKRDKLELIREILIKQSRQIEKIKKQYTQKMEQLLKESNRSLLDCLSPLNGFYGEE